MILQQVEIQTAHKLRLFLTWCPENFFKSTIVAQSSLVFMIYITQLIYLKPGQEVIFNQFEDVAIPMISKYNGRFLLRVRPDNASFIEYHIEKPFEIHLVEFDSEPDFKNFMKDEERKKFLHLKEQSIKSSILIQGTKL